MLGISKKGTPIWRTTLMAPLKMQRSAHHETDIFATISLTRSVHDYVNFSVSLFHLLTYTSASWFSCRSICLQRRCIPQSYMVPIQGGLLELPAVQLAAELKGTQLCHGLAGGRLSAGRAPEARTTTQRQRCLLQKSRAALAAAAAVAAALAVGQGEQ